MATLPALALVVALALQLVAVGFGLWTAAGAARAGARAEHVGGDPRAAARSAIPQPLRRGAELDRDPVVVRLRVPALLPRLSPFRVSARAALRPEGG